MNHSNLTCLYPLFQRPVDKRIEKKSVKVVNTVEIQWLEHLWNHENMFEIGVGWLVVFVLTALCDSISVYIGPSPKEREKEERKG